MTGDAELVRRMYDAIERGDAVAALAVFSADVHWDVSNDVWEDVTGGGHYHGREGVATWWIDLASAWDGRLEIRCDEILEVGDRLVSIATMRGRGRKTGLDVEHHHAGVWTIRDGEAVEVVWFAGREAAVAAAEAQTGSR